MIVVIDTNVWISALHFAKRRGTPKLAIEQGMSKFGGTFYTYPFRRAKGQISPRHGMQVCRRLCHAVCIQMRQINVLDDQTRCASVRALS